MTKNPVTYVTSLYSRNGARVSICIQRKNGRARYYKSSERRFDMVVDAGVRDFRLHVTTRAVEFRRP